MMKYIKHFIILILLFTQFHFINEVQSQSGGTGSQWQAGPLRSSAQYEAGLEGGEGFQMVQSICYAPSNPNVVYLGVDTSGVWKSTDGGNSWESKRIGFRSEGARSVCVDPLNENVVFAAGMIPEGESTVNGIYRTLDGGDTWELVKQTHYSKMVGTEKQYPGEGQFYAFDPGSFDGTRHQTIYAGTHSEGVMKSTDGGDTWTIIGLNGKRVSDIELISADDFTNILYVATNNTNSSGKGLYKIVDDGGGTATITPLGNLPDYPRTIAVNSGDINNIIIYAVVGTYGAYKSTNGGSSFTVLNTGSAASGKEHVIIEISPADPNRLYIGLDKTGKKNPLYTTNGGTSWKQPSDLDYGDMAINGSGGSTYWGMPIAPHPTNSSIALSYLSYTVMKTSDGGATWSYSGSGYMGARRLANKTSAYFDKNNPNRIIYFLIDHGPAITLDGGKTWEMLTVPRNDGRSTPVGASHPDNSNLIITAVGNWTSQYIIRSTDGGTTWDEYTNTSDDYLFMSFHPQNPSYVYAGARSGSWISSDEGQSWTFTSGKSIRAVFPEDGDIVYAIEGRTSDSLLWQSTDRGVTWERLATNPFNTAYDVDIDPLDSNVLYAATPGGVYVFNGKGWSEIGKTNGIPMEKFGNNLSCSVNNIVVDTKNSNIIYAGMDAAGLGKRKQYIFKSTDSGNTWEDIGYNLPGYSRVWSLSIDQNRGDLHMGTSHGNYVLSGQSLVVDIISPSDGAVVNTNPIDVTYTVDGGNQKTLSKSLAEGTNIITITETDEEGNIGLASISVTLDTVTPQITIVSPSSGSTVNTNPVEVTYTVDGGSQKTVNESLNEGNNTVTITEKDEAGNTASASITVRLDTTAPVVKIVTPEDGAIVNSSPIDVKYTVDGGNQKTVSKTLTEDKNTITISETDMVGNKGSASITVTLDTAAPAVMIVSPADGAIVNSSPVTVTYTVDGGSQKTVSKYLTEEENTVTISSTDTAGNTGSVSIKVTLDTAAPKITILSPANGATVKSNPVEVTYTVDGDSAISLSREDSLWAYYDFEEGSGAVAYDSSVHKRDGTIYGNAVYSTGKKGTGLKCDGVNDYVEIGDIDLSDAFTLSAWIKASSFGKNIIIGKTWETYQLFVKEGGTIVFSRNSTNAISYRANLATNTWYHIAVTFDRTNGAVLYLDGSKVATDGNKSATSKNDVATKIGAVGWTAQDYFNGIIDEVRIFSRALASSEVHDLFANQITVSKNLVEGKNTITINETDQAGNTGTASINVTLDTGAPQITILSPSDGSVVNSSPITVTYTVDGGSQKTVSKGLTEGKNTITISETDSVGNTGSVSITVTLDTTVPQVTIVSPEDGALINTNPVVVTYTVDGGSQKTVSKGLTEGKNTITISETDSVGNTGSASITVTLDMTAPQITILSPSDGIVVDADSIEVTYTVDGESALSMSREDNLWAYYDFEEGSGTVAYDSSVYKKDGTIYGNAAYGTGKKGKGLKCDGVNDYVEIGDIDLGDAFTLSAWIKASSFGKNMIIGKTWETYQLFVKDGGTIVVSRNSTNAISYRANLATNTWYHIVATFDMTNGTVLYLEGSEVAANGNTSATSKNDVATKIGATGWTTQDFFSGIIDDVRMFNRSLSAEEVEELFSNKTMVIKNLVEGENTITITETDKAGNTGLAAIMVTLDTTDPQITIVSPNDGAEVNSSPIDVTYTVDGGSQKTVSKSLTEGTNTVTITETDSAGNTGSAMITVKLDTTAPQITIVSPKDGAEVNSSPVTVTYTVDGGSQKTVSKSLTEGTNTVTIAETDSAGNTGSAMITVTLDTTAPQIAIVLPNDGAEVNSSPIDVTYTVDGGSQKTVSKSLAEGENTVTITETDQAGNTGSASIIVTLNSLVAATNSSPIDVTYTVDGGSQKTVSKSLAEGENTITIAETDEAGNTGSAAITVTLDTIAPVVAIVSPKDGAEVDSSPIDVTYTVDGGSQKMVSKSLAEGENTVTITETDQAGNTGSASIIVTLNSLVAATNSKVACYTFDEGSGAVATDTTGNGNDGTVNGAVFSTGKNGTGLSFDGTNDYVSIPCMNYDEISISAWFYKNQNDTSNADAIFGGWNWNSDVQRNEGFDIRFFKNKPDTIDFCLITEDAGGNRTKMTASSDLGNSTGIWYHVACTYTQSTGEQKLYINGALATTENHPAGNKMVPLSSYSDMRIGHSRVNNGYFNGIIDEVSIYDHPLSDQEVQDVYNSK